MQHMGVVLEIKNIDITFKIIKNNQMFACEPTQEAHVAFHLPQKSEVRAGNEQHKNMSTGRRCTIVSVRLEKQD